MSVIHVFLDADPALAGNIPDVPVSNTGLTALGEAVATASTPFVDGDKGVSALVVRKNTAATLVNTDGDYSLLIVDEEGKLWVRDDAPTTPTLDGVTLESADTEYTRDLPNNVKSIMFRTRDDADIRYAYESGKVATGAVPYVTLRSGEVYNVERINLAAGAALYFASDTPGVYVEIEAWS